MTTPQPKAILFDLLTALLDSWTLWTNSIPPSEAEHLTHTTPNSDPGLTWRTEYLSLTYTCGPYTPYEFLVTQSASNVGLSSSAPTTLLRNMPLLRPWPEVPSILADLKSRGFRLGVVTNCSHELGLQTVRNLEEIVRRETGMDGFVYDAVVTAEESGYYKPEAKPYRDCLGKLGLSASEALFVAGSAADIPGAKRVGMRVVWNNHVGLERKDDVLPEKEGRNLGEALEGVL